MLFRSWLRKVTCNLQFAQATHPGRRPARKRWVTARLNVECLEDRTVLSPYVVTTTADAGLGSLRDAITQVNLDTSHTAYASPSNPAVDEIDFNIPTTDPGYNSTTGAF